MHVVVTGAAVFIGSNLVNRLLHNGYTVTAADSRSTGRREFLSETAPVGAALEDAAVVLRVIEEAYAQ